MVPILLPEMGTPRVVFGLWHVLPGDHVFEGERLAEVRIPGAIFDVAAPVSGVFRESLVQPNDPLMAGHRLGAIAPDEGD